MLDCDGTHIVRIRKLVAVSVCKLQHRGIGIAFVIERQMYRIE